MASETSIMTWIDALEFFFASALVSAVATGIAYFWLRHRQVLDLPNERSSHERPTPRGGGLALVPVIALGWGGLAVLGIVPLQVLASVVGALGLAYIGWRDDRAGLGIRVRLLAQIGAVALGVAFLPGQFRIFQGILPWWGDALATAVLWLWFINLFNFMDGIDGLSGGEGAAIGLGVALVALLSSAFDTGGPHLGLILAGASLGFLAWNWQPARLFLGDAGSVPLGYMAGWLLLSLAGRGLWAPALILPLYYLVDATLTLLGRMLRFRAFWRAHREHFYQRSVQSGRSHAAVVLRILAADAGLVGLAVVAIGWPFVALAAALVLVIGLLVELSRAPSPVAVPSEQKSPSAA